MKVLFVIARADTLGGAQTHVLEMAEELQNRGHESVVLVGPGEPLVNALREKQIAWVQLPGLSRSIHPIRDLRSVIEMRERIRQIDPDIVSTHSSKSGVIGRLAARLCRKPCIFTAHGWAFTEGMPEPRKTIYRMLERLSAPLAARIICVSEADHRYALEAGISDQRLITIHNARHNMPAPTRKPNTEDGTIRIAMVGRLDEPKDHNLLLEALAPLTDYELILIGDGPKEPVVRARAQELGMLHRVRFLGLRTDVADLLGDADIFCLISKFEGFPRSTLEAMRASLPVVVSKVGGAPEAVVEGETGFLVERGDVLQLRSRLEALMKDRNLRSRMGRAGRHRFERKFTFETMFDRTLDVYRSVLEAMPPR